MFKVRGSVTFRLVGGLGNQLFILAAGKYFSEKTKFSLSLDCSYLNKDVSKHWVSIDKFELTDKLVYSKILNNKNNILLRVWRYVVNRTATLQKLEYIFTRVYASKEVGFDPNLNRINARYVRGYFQSWRYPESMKEKLMLELELKSPSSWYLQMQNLAIQQQPIILHVRRGDYKNKVNAYMGLLSTEYYRKALTYIRSKNNNSPIWVFSDELINARLTLDFLSDQEVNWISAPREESSPEEELMLMRFGSAHIIANSTFSWWGAFLSQSSRCVIAPSKWFKDIEDPQDLIPPWWTRIESSWE